MSRDETISRLRDQIAALESCSVASFGQASCESDSPALSLPYEFRNCVDAHGTDSCPEDSDSKENKKPSAFDRIVRWTSTRFRSECDLRRRLMREGYSSNQIQEAIDRAARCLLIDDERFADVLVRSRIRAGKGRAGIESELRKENIDPDLLPGWPEEYFLDDANSELDRAVAFLEKHPSKSKNPRQAAYRKLIGKGYNSSVAVAASRIWCERL